ncbi:hypothetical protein GCM10009092_30060 [Bowmanella denitrificans]|uniref:Signal transduction histidine kinase internal region domain-containing protein n=1 Tax=Bowmanella denitrificans TaxID=366582 RepID=A0ABN0XGK7_9ALTE
MTTQPPEPVIAIMLKALSFQPFYKLQPVLPVLVAILVEALVRLHGYAPEQYDDYIQLRGGWALYLTTTGQLLLESLPLMAVQWWLAGHSDWRGYLVWAAGFVMYPALSLMAQNGWPSAQPLLFGGQFWLLTAGLSLLYWLHRAYQQSADMLRSPTWWRYMLSLDAALLLCLGGWVLLMSGMFVYNPDPMHNQPLEPRLDPGQMLSQWPLTLYYGWQFGLLAGIIFVYYWVNRYVLIRRVLAHQGVYPFLLCSAVWLLLSYPLFGALVLQLPLNIAEQSLLPSENHLPFDTLNLLVAGIIWALSTPLILAFERQHNAREVAELTQVQTLAELKMLQQQVNPHFLFNTLNSLYALCLTQSALAAPMLLKLADLLRYVVYQGQKSRVALRDDLAYLQNYLELQQLRVTRRCKIVTDIQIAEGDWQIAPLLLIMLVENAFKHGAEVSQGECDIHLSLCIQAGHLAFECSNSLPEATPDAPTGIGLTNLQRRLQLGYAGAFTLRSERQGQRWVARLEMDL